jgi:quercetin dioxygenase-like cupin family protein
MKNSIRACVLMALAISVIGETGIAQEKPSLVPLSTGKFDSLPGCLTGTVQRGDPAKGAAVLVARLTAGCTIPWRWHTQNENIIMINGQGKVELRGEGPQNVGSGDYFFMPSKHAHQFTCLTACAFYNVIDAAFDIHYVDEDGKEIAPEQALRPANK